MKKKALSLLLALSLCLGILPAQAMAAEGELPAEAPPVEEASSVEETPLVEEMPSVEETPSVEEASSVEDVTPAAEESPVEDVPTDAVLLEGTASGTWWNFTWTLNEAGTLTISGTGDMPNKYSNQPAWLEYRDSVKTAVIEAGVTSIGPSAFLNCKNLTSVTIPDNVTSIDKEAFRGCSGLTHVELPGSVIFIGPGAFSYCPALTSVEIPGGMPNISENVFFGCYKLTNVTISSAVTAISKSAFSNCSTLTSIMIPSSVTYIGKLAFNGCSKLANMEIPSVVHYIGPSAFYGCSSLTSVEVPSRVTTIEESVFYGCWKLENVTFSGNVTSIGKHAFYRCDSLTDIKLPNSVTKIGDSAFYDCDSLTNMEIPSGVTSIGNSAFHSCNRLESVTIENGVTKIGRMAFGGCTALTSVTIPKSVIEIDAYAFCDCRNLPRVTIPNSVTKIGGKVFEDCKKLTDIYYTGSLEQWKSLLEKNTNFIPPENVKVHLVTGEIVLNVALNPNGGQLDTKCIAAAIGKPYSDLPTPTRDGYIFDGWFTAPEDGDQITNGMIVLEDAAQTLYAHWTLDWLTNMTYHFGNSHSCYGYSSNYRIPYERYAFVFGDTPFAKRLYEKEEVWGGNCFGMSSTSAMFTQTTGGESVSAFKSSANRPYDLDVSDTNGAWDLTLTEYIESMQISQFNGKINRHWRRNCSLNEICTQAKAFRQSGKSPIVVAVWGTIEGGKVGGHAMLVYDLIDVSPTESRLMVYDPNYPENKGRYIRFNRSDGAYTGWYYHLNDTYHWGTGDPNAVISYAPYSDFHGVWNEIRPASNRQLDRAAALASENEKSALLIFNSDNATILDAEGNRIAVVEDGQLNTERTDIFPMLNVGVLPDGTVPSNENTALFLPPDQYTLEREDHSDQPLDAVMVHVGQSAAVTTSGSSVTFAVDDGCGLNYAKANGSEAGEYTITLESSLLERPDSSLGAFYEVTASGSLDEEGASAAQLGGALYAENVSAENVQVNGDPVAAEDLGDGGALDIPLVLNPNITAALQEDGSVVLSKSPAGVVHVYAASYDSDGRMTELTAGTLKPEDNTIQFEKPVTEGARIFLLNAQSAPVSRSITIERQA